MLLPDHEYHSLEVAAVVDETADTPLVRPRRPARARGTFRYVAGQFCTFRATIGGESIVRCYSMSSSPDVGEPLTTTVKRVPGGRMSNWMNDAIAPGDRDRGHATDGAVRARARPTSRSWRSPAAAASRR